LNFVICILGFTIIHEISVFTKKQKRRLLCHEEAEEVLAKAEAWAAVAAWAVNKEEWVPALVEAAFVRNAVQLLHTSRVNHVFKLNVQNAVQ